MSVILVTGSYDHEIRFWEAWSGICSRTIARQGESGVSCWPFRLLSSRLTSSVASQSAVNITRVSPRSIHKFFGPNACLANGCWLQQFTRKSTFTRSVTLQIHQQVSPPSNIAELKMEVAGYL
jgi:hypothetical protein